MSTLYTLIIEQFKDRHLTLNEVIRTAEEYWAYHGDTPVVVLSEDTGEVVLDIFPNYN